MCEADENISLVGVVIGYRQGRRVKKVAGPLKASVKQGELVCLLGENGAGKSTLMRSMCGFQPYFDGAIAIAGNAIDTLKEKQLSRLVSVVLTDRIEVANASVRELVELGRSPYTGIMGKLSDEDHQLVDESIEACGIAHKRNELLSNLSDGERQKVFIAKALAQNTPVILLDEPTAFLDLPARVEIMQLLRRIASSGNRSVLMSTHDLDLALQLSDQLWLLNRKGIIQSGSPEDLLLGHSFQNLFEREGVHFDPADGSFRVQYPVAMQITGRGDQLLLKVLSRALARKHIELLNEELPEADFYVEASQQDGFSLKTSSNHIVVHSRSVKEFLDGIYPLFRKLDYVQ